jgi:hypothetical protein
MVSQLAMNAEERGRFNINKKLWQVTLRSNSDGEIAYFLAKNSRTCEMYFGKEQVTFARFKKLLDKVHCR